MRLVHQILSLVLIILLKIILRTAHCKNNNEKQEWRNAKDDDKNFTFMWPCIITNFFIIKPTRCTHFTNLFWHETLHVLDSSSVHHQEFIHCTYSNGICHTAFEQDQDGTEFHPGPAQKLSTYLYDIYHCWVDSELTPDDGQTNCPKHVELHDKINLWN
jgi:hypothetical protein